MNLAFKKTWTLLLTAILGLVLATAPARADEMSDLKARFAQRLPQVRGAKDAGVIGETAAGKLEAVKGGLDAAVQGTVDEENADRSKLYDLIGKKEGTTVDVVARQNAVRNFTKAKKGDWLKSEGGQWTQKK